MEAQERHQTTPADLGVRSQLLLEKHASYIKRVADVSSTQVHPLAAASADIAELVMQSTDSLESHVTEHFRLSGVYWGLTALYLMGRLDTMDGTAIVDWVCTCICQAAFTSACTLFLTVSA